MVFIAITLVWSALEESDHRWVPLVIEREGRKIKGVHGLLAGSVLGWLLAVGKWAKPI